MRRFTRPVWPMGVILLAMLVAACGARPTPTPTPPPPTRVTLPTPYPTVALPPGLPPATSLLPQDAWLVLRVETDDGARWTAVSYPDRDEVYDERNNRVWVDRGRFWGRYRHLWYALLNQARFWDWTEPAYWTACSACPRVAFAVRTPETGTPRGLWLRLRPYDAPPALLPLLPVVNTLRLYVETLQSRFPPGEITSRPMGPASPQETPDVLALLYGDALTFTAGSPRVGPNVTPWVGARMAGAFTAADRREQVVLVGGSGAKTVVDEKTRPYVEARLVVLQASENGWQVVGRSSPLALNVAWEDLGVVLEPAIDVDRDGRQEIPVLMASLLPGYLDGIYRLYRWDGTSLRQVWTATALYDNTTVPQQPDYATQIAWPEWTDRDGDGTLDIVLHVIRRTYARTEQGVPDTSRIVRQTAGEVLYRWTGRGFMLATP